MSHRKLLFSAALAAVLCTVYSFRPAGTTHADPATFSVDPLPSAWKNSSSVVRAIDIIIPGTVDELRDGVHCKDCNSSYSIGLLVDSAIILKQTTKDISNKRNNEGFQYETVTTFAFKSSLAVYNKNQKGVAKVQITDPLKDEYTVKKRFNIVREKGAPRNSKLQTPEEYVASHAAEVNPNQEDLLGFAEKKLYRLRDQVEKLYKRR